MEFQILGKVCLRVDGKEVELGAAKNRSLLGLLLLMGTRPVLPQSLFEPLWNEEDRPPEPRETLQTYVAKLRGKLKKAGCADLLPMDLRTRTYKVAIDFELVDYYRFKGLARRGRTALTAEDYDSAIRDLTEATQLWQGPLIAELKTDWIEQRRDIETAQTLLPAYYDLCTAYLAHGDHDAALRLLEDELTGYDTDETLAQYRMHALAEAGRGHEIPAYHHSFRQHYLLQRGVEPSSDFTDTFEQLKRHTASSSFITKKATGDAGYSLACALPRDTPHFTDRDDIAAQLDALLLTPSTEEAAPVVTLDGLPGVGKTCLAVHWAYQHSDQFPDGRFYVELNGYGQRVEPTDVYASLLAALGGTPTRDTNTPLDLAALVHRELRNKRALIILDNAYDSTQVRPLLAALAPCPVIVTSRQHLNTLTRHEGAQRIQIRALDGADSAAFLRGQYELDSSAAAEIADLCAGLPIALTIVGEHVASRPEVPVGDLINQLRQRKPRLLDAGSHGDGTLTLSGVFQPSYTALPSEVKRLFRLLGLHSTARFSVPAAAALIGTSPDHTEKLLGILCGASLVRQEHPDIYRLHDLLYLYAKDCASHEEEPASRNHIVTRMLDWYLHTAHAANRAIAPHTPPVPDLPAQTDIEPLHFVNEEEAAQWCVRERNTLLGIVQIASEHGFHDHCWRLVAEVREVFRRYGDQRDVLEIHRLALFSAQQTGDTTAQAGTISNLGTVYFHLHDFDQAAEHFQRALELFQECEYLQGQIASLHNLGATAVEYGRFREGIKLYQRSLDLIEQVNSDNSRANTHYKLGQVYRRQEQHDVALAHYHLALNLSQHVGNHRVQGIIMGEVGALHLELRDLEKCILYCAQAMEIHRQSLDELASARTLSTLTEAHHIAKDYSRTVDLATEALKIHQMNGDLRAQARMLSFQAYAYNAMGNLEAGRASWSEQLSVLLALGDPAAEEVRAQLDALSRLEASRATDGGRGGGDGGDGGGGHDMIRRAAESTGLDRTHVEDRK